MIGHKYHMYEEEDPVEARKKIEEKKEERKTEEMITSLMHTVVVHRHIGLHFTGL